MSLKERKLAEAQVIREVYDRVMQVVRVGRQTSNPEEIYQAIFGHPQVKVVEALSNSFIEELATELGVELTPDQREDVKLRTSGELSDLLRPAMADVIFDVTIERRESDGSSESSNRR